MGQTPEKLKKYRVRYYQKNRTKIRARVKDYERKNKDVINIKAKIYRDKHKNAAKKYMKKYYKDNRKRLGKYNRLKAKALLIKLKTMVYNHYGWLCNCCGETTPKFLTIDHVNNDGYKDTIQQTYVDK